MSSCSLLLVTLSRLFRFSKHFRKSTKTLQWPDAGSEILAGYCTVLVFPSVELHPNAKNSRVLYRNQSDNTVIASLHAWQYLAAIVKAFYRCCLVVFLSLQYLLVAVIKSKYCRSCTNPWGLFLVFIFYSFSHTTDVNPQTHDTPVWEIGQWVRAIWK